MLMHLRLLHLLGVAVEQREVVARLPDLCVCVCVCVCVAKHQGEILSRAPLVCVCVCVCVSVCVRVYVAKEQC